MPTQVAWLRQGDEERTKSKNLQQKLMATGINITEIDPESGAFESVQSTDLIFIEYYGYFHRDIATLLSQLRNNSQAPIVMLTDNQTFDWSSSAISAGADAIVTVATSDEVIIARCQALLRRWRAGR